TFGEWPKVTLSKLIVPFTFTVTGGGERTAGTLRSARTSERRWLTVSRSVQSEIARKSGWRICPESIVQQANAPMVNTLSTTWEAPIATTRTCEMLPYSRAEVWFA